MKITKDPNSGSWFIDGKTADAHTAAKLNRVLAMMEKLHAIAEGRKQHGHVL